ncbi:MAG: class I SAM-dependent RNA methyltransferase [Nitrosomonas sp.]|nr:class I SAM-dependent RNA methyltransferase [Nitrosomonas sp.]
MAFKGQITHLSQKGLGVVQNEQDGISYFVSGTWPGDYGEFEVIDRRLPNKKYGYAKLVQLLQPAVDRQHAPCPFLGTTETACAGCPWMIASYASQLEQKRNRFMYAMKRVGFDTGQLTIPPVHPSPLQYGYRNRFQVKTDGHQLGFVTEGAHQIAPIQDCLVLNETCRSLLHKLRDQLPQSDWQPVKNFDWSFIDVDDDLPFEHIRLNHKRPFKQGNSEQNTWIKAWLSAKIAENPAPQKIIELFCGSGNFTEILAASGCRSIIAYEVELDAIRQLKTKHLPNVDAQSIDLFKPFVWKTIKKVISDADTLMLDPPRAGLKNMKGFFEYFCTLKTIYYISCDPESFARDAWAFAQKGWTLTEIQLVDLFPHTPHVETLAVLKK